MYGFGDDRNPANDTVNVMEEILAEYIVDVVSNRRTRAFLFRKLNAWRGSVRLRWDPRASRGSRSMTSAEFSQDQPMPRNWPEWRSFFSCRRK